MIEVVSAVVSALAAVIAIFALLRVSAYAEQAHRDARIGRTNADELALAHSRLDMLQTALKRIEGRQVKAAGRAQAANQDGEPDPKIDPAAWRAWKNKQLSKGRIQ
jgi:hypothetical protein